MNFNVLVIGHTENNYRLPDGFKYVQRTSNETLNVSGFHHFQNSSLVWSEYSAWFENRHFFTQQQLNGITHYRCALNLTKLKFDKVPFQFRRFFLQKLKTRINSLENFIIVGIPLSTPTGMWRQYFDYKPDSINALDLGCGYYDEIAGTKAGSTLERMKTSENFYIRNIFVSDTEFALEWTRIALIIAQKLDINFKEKIDDRWGGFVLERLFSLFVEDYVKTNGTQLITAEHIYFLDLSAFLRGLTLQIKRKLLRI